MNKPEENDPIEKLLREQESYTADDGFTARVMTRLPRRKHAWVRPVVLLGAAAAGTVLAVRWLPGTELPPLELTKLAASPEMLTPWLVVAVVVGSLIWAVRTAVRAEE